MRTRLLTATGIALALAVSAGLMLRGGADATPTPGPTMAIPAKADNFMLIDQTGFGHDLLNYREASAIVIVSQANGDHASRKAAAELASMQHTFAKAQFFMLNSSLKDTRATIAAEAKSLGINFPILDDSLQLVGESLGVTHTAEAFLIDPISMKIVYHGPINADFAEDKSEDYYLLNALVDLTSHRPIRVASVPGNGTAISFPSRDRKDAYSKISYSKTIAPILESKCVDCHQQGGIGPFAMSSYDVVKGFGPMIREVVRTDRMPPWHSDDQINTFQHNKSLTNAEITTLVHWIEGGAPRGDGVDPLITAAHVAPEWPLGKPDLVVDIPAYKLAASGIIDYQYPFVSNVVTEGKWLKASTIKGGQRQGVHHVLTGIVTNPPADGKVSTSQWGASVGGYAVGSESIRMPANVGTYIPPGAGIGFQMHYTPFGKEAVDESKVGLYFYRDEEKPDLMMRQSVVIDTTIEIPPNAARHAETAYLKFPKVALLYSVFPHAHYRGIYTDIFLITPDGKQKELMATPHYDFNWQREYEFEKPVTVPAGSKLVAHYIFDNSAGNPANPDPSSRVLWGEQSHEEMLYSAVRFRWMDETADKPTKSDDLLNQNRLIGMMDDNLDEKLQSSELRGKLGEGVRPEFARLDVNADGGLDLAELAPVMQMMSARGRSQQQQ
jgi:hypothetical protein